jgi:hypothetical protein
LLQLKAGDAAFQSFALARYIGDAPGTTFDLCLQDESNGNLLQMNTTTGDYQFTNCAGLTLDGASTLTKRGSLFTLQQNASDRRLIARADIGTGKGIATFQLLSQSLTF